MASVITTAFTTTGVGDQLLVRYNDEFTYEVTGTFSATWIIERSQDQQNWEIIVTGTGTQSAVKVVERGSTYQPANYRFRCSSYISGTMTTTITEITDEIIFRIKDKSGNDAITFDELGITGGTVTASGDNIFSGNNTFLGDNIFTGGAFFEGEYDVFVGSGDLQFFVNDGFIDFQTLTGDISFGVNGTGDDIVLSAASNGSDIYLNSGVRLDRQTTASNISSTWRSIIGITSTGTPRAITLESDTNVSGHIIIVKDEGGGAGTDNITITPESGTIDGASNYVINTNYGVMRAYGTGTNWFTF